LPERQQQKTGDSFFFWVDVLDGAISRFVHTSGDCQPNDCGEKILTQGMSKDDAIGSL
jgi:hypothetical protein